MCEEEYVLVSINEENKYVFVEKQTFALKSKEAMNAHANFNNLKSKFAMEQPLYGYSMVEVKRTKNDNQSLNGSNYDFVGMVEFDIREVNPADINVIPNKFGGKM
ncbi:MAG: hypothetical protein IJO33_00155 [Bacilli bacterium]|nr:hypothetical protein [Bacilli bacterium]